MTNKISRYRRKELYYYCLQYKEWEKLYLSRSLISTNYLTDIANPSISDKTSKIATEQAILANKMKQIKMIAKEADPELAFYIFKNVTDKNCSIVKLQVNYDMPCSEKTLRRRCDRFYEILSKIRE